MNEKDLENNMLRSMLRAEASTEAPALFANRCVIDNRYTHVP